VRDARLLIEGIDKAYAELTTSHEARLRGAQPA
jgi:hypothetical protein